MTDETPATRTLGVGLLGCGTVGAALCDLIAENSEHLSTRTRTRLDVRRVAVRDMSKPRETFAIPDGALTDRPEDVVTADDVDIVVELMGGIHPANELIATAIANGKPVVTANKELVASRGGELTANASAAGVDLQYEAAVGGGIPLVRALRVSLAGEPLFRAMGIVNGTTNYILTRMSEEGASYKEALGQAQQLGFAEADPTADVEGHDAASKAAIIATIAFGANASREDVWTQGTSAITADDIAEASRLGYVIKMLAMIERETGAEDSRVGVRVHPTLVPKDHPLASVRLSFNALFLDGPAAGELMLYGRGAGGRPTASAVLGDVLEVAHHLTRGGSVRVPQTGSASLMPIEQQRSAFFISIDVADNLGVLATVARAFGEHRVSIRSMEQIDIGENARLVFVTHIAQVSDVWALLDALRTLDCVRDVGNVFFVLSE